MCLLFLWELLLWVLCCITGVTWLLTLVCPLEWSWMTAVWSSGLWEKWLTESPQPRAIGQKRGETVFPCLPLRFLIASSLANLRNFHFPTKRPLFYLGFLIHWLRAIASLLLFQMPVFAVTSHFMLLLPCSPSTYQRLLWLTSLLVFGFWIRILTYLFHIFWTCPVLNHVGFFFVDNALPRMGTELSILYTLGKCSIMELQPTLYFSFSLLL